MPEVSWQTMVRDHPRGHLLVGVAPLDQDGSSGSLKLRCALLAKLAKALRLVGKYAITDIPARSGNEVHCWLESPADAAKLGAAVGAADAGPSVDWASRRSFLFDDSVVDSISLRAVARSAGRGKRKKRGAALF